MSGATASSNSSARATGVAAANKIASAAKTIRLPVLRSDSMKMHHAKVQRRKGDRRRVSSVLCVFASLRESVFHRSQICPEMAKPRKARMAADKRDESHVP